MANMKPGTYETAQVRCANYGGIVLPISDSGLLNFVQQWGPKAVRSDIWVGMKTNSLKRVADMSSTDKRLQEIVVEHVVMESDGLSGEQNFTDAHKKQVGISRARYLSLKIQATQTLQCFLILIQKILTKLCSPLAI